MNCSRCNQEILRDLFYQGIHAEVICPQCAVIGEELLPDSLGDLQVSENGKQHLMDLVEELMACGDLASDED